MNFSVSLPHLVSHGPYEQTSRLMQLTTIAVIFAKLSNAPLENVIE